MKTRRWYWLSILFLLVLNAFICRELFVVGYSTRVNSGDASFISISRYMMDHWRDLTWWPAWYDGIPGHNAYPPFFHAFVAVVAKLERAAPALAHHQLSGLLYCLGPIGVFVMTARLYGSTGASLAAGIAYSLFSPSPFLVKWVRLDIGGLFRPWRLYVLFGYGDAPHMFGLALIPFALLSLDAALKRRRPWLYFLTALLLAAIALSNWLSAVAMACAVVMYLLATHQTRRDFSRWGITALIGASAYLLASPWIPPSTVRLIQLNGQFSFGDVRAEMAWFPLRAAILAAVLLLMKALFLSFRVPVLIQFAAFFAVVPGSFPLLQAWSDISIVPMPHRYQFEMELALSLLVVLSIHHYVLSRSPRAVTWVALGLATLFACFQVARYREYAIALIQPIDMTKTVEFEIAEWLKQHAADERVFTIGTVSYWLNNFTDVVQMTGGFESAEPSRQLANAIRGISDGAAWGAHDGDLARLWLQAYGVDLVVAGGPKTRAPFRMFTDPAKFDRFAQKVWQDGDDAVYLAPRQSRSLAHVVRTGDLVAHPPQDEFDVGEVSRYVTALENPALPAASFVWKTHHSAEIRADVPAGDVIAVQVTYDPAWRASVAGKQVPVARDGLDLMVVQPGCVGPCEVELIDDGGWEGLLTNLAALITLAGYVGFCLATRRQAAPHTMIL